jgi:hypothetical protein
MTSRRLASAPVLLLVIAATSNLLGQGTTGDRVKPAGRPVQAESSSKLSYSAQEGVETVEIRNTTYEVTDTGVPGRPPSEHLVLRKTVHSKQVLDEVGVEATTTIEAWPLGTGLEEKPLYAVSLTGVDARTVDNAFVEFRRGLEEVEWWSVHKLATGEHLFDTYVPLLRFSISRETLTLRYFGLEVPPDDVADSRLREPHVVAVLTYASGDGLIREALLTCDDPTEARGSRSYADEERTVSLTETLPGSTQGRRIGETARSIKILFSQSFPSPPNTLSVVVPLVRDSLDLDHAKLPPRLHLAAWRR